MNPSHFHLILDGNYAFREGFVALPGQPPRRGDIPIKDFSRFLEALRSLPDSASLRHSDGILYRLTRYAVRDGFAVVAVPTWRPPASLSDLSGAAPIARALELVVGRTGLILFMGDMAAGKTTTATTFLLEALRRTGGTAFAWMDPVEYDLEGSHGDGYCHQLEIATHEYRAAAVAAKRSRARYLFFGETRTPETAIAVLDAGLSGPLTLTTSHGDSLINGLLAFLAKAEAVDPRAPQLLAAALTAAFHLTLRHVAGAPTLTVASLIVSPSPADSIRAMIRAGNVEGMGTEIRRQQSEQARLLT